MSKSRAETSVLIASYNTREVLLEALASTAREPDVETIVVDNASVDGSADAVNEHFPSVTLVRSSTNLGFAGATNRAACEAQGQYLLLLNPDAALMTGALDALLDFARGHPRLGAVGPSLVYPDGRPQSAAFRFPGLAQVLLDLFPVPRLMETPLNGRIHSSVATRIDHPMGACMLIPRAAWEAVGPLDEGYFMYLEEVDWCRRAWAHGWETWYEPRARVVHHAGAATRQHRGAMYAQLWRSRLRYYQRYHGPFYNRVIRSLIRVGVRDTTVRQLVR